MKKVITLLLAAGLVIGAASAANAVDLSLIHISEPTRP